MTTIAIFCEAGISTSLLVSRMKKEAQTRGIKVDIQAYPEIELARRVKEIDVALLGPQVKYMLRRAKSVCEPNGVPVEVISSTNFGTMQGGKVLDLALQMAE